MLHELDKEMERLKLSIYAMQMILVFTLIAKVKQRKSAIQFFFI